MAARGLFEHHVFEECRHLVFQASWSGILLVGLGKLNYEIAIQLTQCITLLIVIFGGGNRRGLPLKAILVRIGTTIMVTFLAAVFYTYFYAKSLHYKLHPEDLGFKINWITEVGGWWDTKAQQNYFFWLMILAIFRTAIFTVSFFIELGDRLIIFFRLNERLEL